MMHLTAIMVCVRYLTWCIKLKLLISVNGEVLYPVCQQWSRTIFFQNSTSSCSRHHVCLNKPVRINKEMNNMTVCRSYLTRNIAIFVFIIIISAQNKYKH